MAIQSNNKSNKKRTCSYVLLLVVILGAAMFGFDTLREKKTDNYRVYINEIVETDTNDNNTVTMDVERMYLDLLKDTLLGKSIATRERSVNPFRGNMNDVLQKLIPYNATKRDLGFDWPYIGMTMIGTNRMDDIEKLLRNVTEENIEGDFIECGVWRGGASIFARAVLNIIKQPNRHVWVVDSFQGLPPPRNVQNKDMKDGSKWSEMGYLSVSLEEVKENFKNFGLLDENDADPTVHFIKGFFKDSLRTLPKDLKLAVARLDGDMYQSTMDELYFLYEKVTIGGWLIIDDWCIGSAQNAVRDFCNRHNIELPLSLQMFEQERCGAYFRKTKNVQLDWSLYQQSLGQ